MVSNAESVSPELLALVRCPLTAQRLRFASAEELAALALDTALVREDGAVAYPIRDGMPVLLPEAAMTLK